MAMFSLRLPSSTASLESRRYCKYLQRQTQERKKETKHKNKRKIEGERKEEGRGEDEGRYCKYLQRQNIHRDVLCPRKGRMNETKHEKIEERGGRGQGEEERKEGGQHKENINRSSAHPLKMTECLLPYLILLMTSSRHCLTGLPRHTVRNPTSSDQNSWRIFFILLEQREEK